MIEKEYLIITAIQLKVGYVELSPNGETKPRSYYVVEDLHDGRFVVELPKHTDEMN